jgi:hypothetical protein
MTTSPAVAARLAAPNSALRSVFSSAKEFTSDSVGQTRCLILDIAMPG